MAFCRHQTRPSTAAPQILIRHLRPLDIYRSINAAAESFWATLKKELIHLRPFDTIDRVRAGVFEYIEIYYNRQRIHSAIDYLTPVEFEEKFDESGLCVA
ncbi:IS3 family transposase [Parafrankia sp. FMc2]|uniref:IS3 family transposase n=1 Tax=Parafrankia sp. FMc2 TaxID=3233196 RepID=UPI0034D66847